MSPLESVHPVIFASEGIFLSDFCASMRQFLSGLVEEGLEDCGSWSPLPPRSWFYLEIMELDWDWLEEVVAALSWEKPLWLDSRLVMEPLKSSEPSTSV